MLRNISTSFWFQFMPAVVLGILTIILLFLGIIPIYYLITTFVMWTLVCGLGIAVGYHRVFSHKTHNLPRWKENFILFCAVFAGQGPSIFWVTVHRGYHHRFSDTENDPHSPVAHGDWHAFVGWQLDIIESNPKFSMKYAVDLARKSNHVWFHKHHLSVLWLTPIIVALFDWRLALTGFWLVTMIGILQDNLVNVLGHRRAVIGYRNFETNDNSYNNPILALTSWGQGWHNNHHYASASYDFGTSISGNWWEFDPARIFLPFLGKQRE